MLIVESENVKVFNGDIRIDKEVKNFFNSMDNSLLCIQQESYIQEK